MSVESGHARRSRLGLLVGLLLIVLGGGLWLTLGSPEPTHAPAVGPLQTVPPLPPTSAPPTAPVPSTSAPPIAIRLPTALPEKNVGPSTQMEHADRMLPTGHERLTLITCRSYTTYTYRLILTAAPLPLGVAQPTASAGACYDNA